MIRIKGTVGPWPVDLAIELDDADWQRLGSQLAVQPVTAPAPVTPGAPGAKASPDDAKWLAALRLVEQAGQVPGPELMEQLEGLAGSAGAAKRLLVRLRHCAQVRVQTDADAPLYCWVG
ncbi:hypothetical protein [Pseudomonas sp. KNUC1026]|uniref:hypothetical protein n=1 Tax=Pseudomonas sp. KNUC1026 TaxID=2893890 RepID=UPI001F4038F5|nr:hypothetical protein [Pseudomonas sp. KNUC1026]UFH48963.1 hypothetical protein LN139_18660 [Pseudomonas sp. KNUC1026]